GGGPVLTCCFREDRRSRRAVRARRRHCGGRATLRRGSPARAGRYLCWRLAAASAVEPDRDRARVGIEPLGVGERDGGIGERAQLLWPAFEDRSALDEIKHAKAGRESRRAR